MEMSLAASAFVRYVYNGKTPIVLDDHNPDYDLEIDSEDEFSLRVTGSKVEIRAADSNEIFNATTTDKKYLKLMRLSTPEEFVFVPHPKKPCYPFIPKITFEMIPKLYAYFNDTYFNGMCPKSLLFKRSTSQAFLGLAEMNNNVGGKRLYRMTVNMKSISKDSLLFVDVLLHEMIHLYLYRKGLDERNNSIINDGHGRYFQAEMHRLNKFGFNIDVTLKWEKRELDDNLEINIIRVTNPAYPNHAKYFWSGQNLEDQFDGIVKQLVSSGITGDFKVELIIDKNSEVRGFTQVGNNFKIPPAKIKLWYTPIALKGRLIKQFDTRDNTRSTIQVETKVAKKEEPHYAQPYQLFAAYMKRTNPESKEDRLRALWENFPAKKVGPHAEVELVDINKARKRGANEAEIKRRLTNVYARFEGRCSHMEYRRIVIAILDKHKMDDLRYYSQLGL